MFPPLKLDVIDRIAGEICVGFTLSGKISASPSNQLCDTTASSSSVNTTPERTSIPQTLSSDSLQSLDSSSSQDDTTPSLNNVEEDRNRFGKGL